MGSHSQTTFKCSNSDNQRLRCGCNHEIKALNLMTADAEHIRNEAWWRIRTIVPAVRTLALPRWPRDDDPAELCQLMELIRPEL